MTDKGTPKKKSGFFHDMKKALPYILVIGCIIAYCTQEEKPESKVKVGQYKELDLSSVHLSNYPDGDWLAYKIQNILDGDIITFFSLNEKYPTELKRKKFLESQEADSLKTQMKKKLSKLLNQIYKIRIDLGKKDDIGSYDIKSKAFRINISGRVKRSSWENTDPEKKEAQKINGLWFLTLPVKVDDTEYSFSTYVNIYTNEETALKIENNDRESVYLIFNPKINSDSDIEYLEAINVGLVIVAEESGGLLYGAKFSDFDEKTVWKYTYSLK
jgi:hypothetical protein